MAVLAHFFEIAPKPNQPPILLFRRVVRRYFVHRIGKLYDPKNGKLYDPKNWKNYMILKMENYMIQKMENYMIQKMKIYMDTITGWPSKFLLGSRLPLA